MISSIAQELVSLSFFKNHGFGEKLGQLPNCCLIQVFNSLTLTHGVDVWIGHVYADRSMIEAFKPIIMKVMMMLLDGIASCKPHDKVFRCVRPSTVSPKKIFQLILKPLHPTPSTPVTIITPVSKGRC